MKKEQVEEIKFCNKILYEVQKHRVSLYNMVLSKLDPEKVKLLPDNWKEAIKVLKVEIEKAKGKYPVTKRMITLFDDVVQIEKDAEAVIKEVVEDASVWMHFLKDVKGIGEKLASTLIAEIEDIGRFSTVSSLWAYAGLTAEYVIGKCEDGHKLIMSSDRNLICQVRSRNPEKKGKDAIETCGKRITILNQVKGEAPKRKKGHHYMFNTNLKTTAWKICSQFIKQGDETYKNIYYKEKEKYLNAGVPLGHSHNRAMRKMVKIFLSHLWVRWREIEGLPVKLPYVIDVLKHDSYVRPPV